MRAIIPKWSNCGARVYGAWWARRFWNASAYSTADVAFSHALITKLSVKADGEHESSWKFTSQCIKTMWSTRCANISFKIGINTAASIVAVGVLCLELWGIFDTNGGSTKPK